jgi:hypothetical protein
VRDPNLTGCDIRVLCAVGIHTDGRTGKGCFARAATLADEAGVSKNQFFTSAKKLIEGGYLRRESGQADGVPSSYSVILDPTTKIGVPAQSAEGRGHPAPDGAPTMNAPINASSSSVKMIQLVEEPPAFLSPGFEPDYLELLEKIRKAGGSVLSWQSEMLAALDGMHGPPATPLQVSQAIRHFAGNGAEPVLRLFGGYLRSSVAGPRENGSSGELDGKKVAYSGRRGGKTLEAAELIRRMRKAAVPNPYGGGLGLSAKWQDNFLPSENRVIMAFGTSRILNDANEGTLVSQLAKALEEVRT